jgi:hypothetical protein
MLKESGAWDTLVWFAALVMMASFLNKPGVDPLVLAEWMGGAGRRLQLGTGLSGALAGLLLQPLFLRQQHRPRERHVRRFPGRGRGGRHAPVAGSPGAGILQQPVQQHDPLRHRPGARCCTGPATCTMNGLVADRRHSSVSSTSSSGWESAACGGSCSASGKPTFCAASTLPGRKV